MVPTGAAPGFMVAALPDELAGFAGLPDAAGVIFPAAGALVEAPGCGAAVGICPAGIPDTAMARTETMTAMTRRARVGFILVSEKSRN